MSEKIRSFSFEEYVEIVRSFHSYPAPGVLIGGFMVELAYRQLPENGIYDVISETGKCLPDAVQLLTPCTIGNTWLKVIDTGRFAIIVYDKAKGEGIRVFVDPDKIEKWPEIKNWFFKLKPKKEQDTQLLMHQIKEAGTGILNFQTVMVGLVSLEKHKENYIVCPECGESYPAAEDGICLGCKGKLPYKVT